MGNTSLKEHLPSTSSIYTAELRAILLAFKLINKSSKEHFVICTDSLSSLMAIRNLKQDHPLLPDIFDSYTCMGGRRSPAVACWASDHWLASSNPLSVLEACEATAGLAAAGMAVVCLVVAAWSIAAAAAVRLCRQSASYLPS